MPMRAISGKFVIDDKGRKTGVILSMKEYQRLIEDLHDLAVIAERRDEEAISLEEKKRRLGTHGTVKRSP